MTTKAERARWRRMKRVLAILELSYLIRPHDERQQGILPDRLMPLQDGRCYLCGEPMVTPDRSRPMPGRQLSPLTRSRDHVIPKARTGPNRRNQLLACHGCNEAKANRLPTACELIYLAGVNARLEAA